MPLLSLVAATVAGMILCTVWYLPQVLGNVWMHLAHVSHETLKSRDPKMPMLITLGSTFVTSFLLAVCTIAFRVTLARQALALAIILSLLFALVRLPHTLFEGRSIKLYLFYTAYDSASILLMTLVLSLWR